jgi:hypothetical protein
MAVIVAYLLLRKKKKKGKKHVKITNGTDTNPEDSNQGTESSAGEFTLEESEVQQGSQ